MVIPKSLLYSLVHRTEEVSQPLHFELVTLAHQVSPLFQVFLDTLIIFNHSGI